MQLRTVLATDEKTMLYDLRTSYLLEFILVLVLVLLVRVHVRTENAYSRNAFQ